MSFQVPFETAAKVFLDAKGSLSINEVAREHEISRHKFRYFLENMNKTPKLFSMSKEAKKCLQHKISAEYEQNGPVSREFVMYNAKELSKHKLYPSLSWYHKLTANDSRFADKKVGRKKKNKIKAVKSSENENGGFFISESTTNHLEEIIKKLGPNNPKVKEALNVIGELRAVSYTHLTLPTKA